MSEDDSVKHEGKWTRADLPSWVKIRDADDMAGNGLRSRVIDIALNEVVEHLNAHHPKPAHRLLSSAAECVLGAEDRVRSAKAERDAAVERAERAEGKLRRLRDAHSDLIARHRRLSDEMEQSAPAVSRADVERVVHRYIDGGFDELHVSRVKSATDAFMALLSGSDPAVYVVRESDIAAVEVEQHESGSWHATSPGLHSGYGRQPFIDMDVDRYKVELLNALAVQRAIEAERAVDPVEAKARELYEVGNPGTVGMWESIHEAFKDGYRRIARHVLGQEADQ